MTLFQLRKTIEARLGKSLSASRVATEMGVKKQQYWSYEQGANMPGIFVVRSMTRYFQQWIPDLTIEQMIDILEETKQQKSELAA